MSAQVRVASRGNKLWLPQNALKYVLWLVRAPLEIFRAFVVGGHFVKLANLRRKRAKCKKFRALIRRFRLLVLEEIDGIDFPRLDTLWPVGNVRDGGRGRAALGHVAEANASRCQVEIGRRLICRRHARPAPSAHATATAVIYSWAGPREASSDITACD